MRSVNNKLINVLFLESNQQSIGILRQHKFLNKLLERLNSPEASKVLEEICEVRNIVTGPKNLALYFAGGLDQLKNPVAAIENFLPPRLEEKTTQERCVCFQLL